jgi:hypothetical protein
LARKLALGPDADRFDERVWEIAPLAPLLLAGGRRLAASEQLVAPVVSRAEIQAYVDRYDDRPP